MIEELFLCCIRNLIFSHINQQKIFEFFSILNQNFQSRICNFLATNFNSLYFGKLSTVLRQLIESYLCNLIWVYADYSQWREIITILSQNF